MFVTVHDASLYSHLSWIGWYLRAQNNQIIWAYNVLSCELNIISTFYQWSLKSLTLPNSQWHWHWYIGVLKVYIHNNYKEIQFNLFRLLSTFYNSDRLLIKEIDKETNGLSDFHWGTIQPAIDCGTRDTCSFRIHFHFRKERKNSTMRKYCPTTWICRDLIPAVSLLMLLPITEHVMTLWFMNIHRWLI